MSAAARRAVTWLHRVEDGLIAVAVLVLILVAGAQILLRNVFETGLAFADPMLRALVLWTAMLGALAAARENRHIGLDIVTFFVRGRAARALRVVSLGFAAAICTAMAWYSVTLVQLDWDSGAEAFAGVPVWAVESILPVGFALLALRLIVQACLPPPPPAGEPA
ncbi:MAG TPA: TRAP transporter small permease [Dokdonella sp.]|uniref:TRAP transporter small permease n=1 Tax=Dokdonella sp. TaxID=2291710 RepID=UPI002D0FE4D1|nr:TRAP transporter small permease [Dokdonella sp.]HUD43732.1 TRAP transporter small permease [Dokdonella sp.]